MIVDRRAVMPKRGYIREARAVLRELLDLWESKLGPITCRIYRPKAAPFDLVTWETEFESIAEWDRLQDEYSALPELAPLVEKWVAVTESGGIHELFELEE